MQLRTMRVCDYVDLPFETVSDLLRAPELEDQLVAALAVALGIDVDEATVSAGELEAVTDGVSRLHVTWQTAGHDGEGTILLLALQTGRDSITELLATVAVRDERAPEAAAATRRFLEHLVAELAHAGRQLPKSHPSPAS
jgi:hypothetical protein